jgi:dihydrofolate reductase
MALRGSPVFVLSTNALPADERIERLEGEPRDILARLEARGFTHAYVDGGLTIQRFLRAGAIGSLVVTRVPVLIGTGIPLFGPTEKDILLRTWRRGRTRPGSSRANTR